MCNGANDIDDDDGGDSEQDTLRINLLSDKLLLANVVGICMDGIISVKRQVCVSFEQIY